jgi:serine/threonine protein phosphatase PrpC
VLLLPEADIVFNVGDSRVYTVGPWPATSMTRVSTDDNPPLLPGQRTTSILTQSLGGWSGAPTPNTHIVEIDATASPGTYLMCSDGLSDLVDDDVIAAEMAAVPSDGTQDHLVVAALVEAALAAGGNDNITIILLRVDRSETGNLALPVHDGHTMPSADGLSMAPIRDEDDVAFGVEDDAIFPGDDEDA